MFKFFVYLVERILYFLGYIKVLKPGIYNTGIYEDENGQTFISGKTNYKFWVKRNKGSSKTK